MLARPRFVAPWKRTAGRALELTLSELALFIEGSQALGRVELSPPLLRMIDLRPKFPEKVGHVLISNLVGCACWMTIDEIDDVATLRRAAKLPEAENQKMARMIAKLKKQLHELHLADEGDQVCKACGGRLTEWSGQYEESEEGRGWLTELRPGV